MFNIFELYILYHNNSYKRINAVCTLNSIIIKIYFRTFLNDKNYFLNTSYSIGFYLTKFKNKHNIS